MLSWDFPYSLGGPVLAWELHRGMARRGARILAIGFFALCLLYFLITAYSFEQRYQKAQPNMGIAYSVLMQGQTEAKMLFTSQYLAKFFPIQVLSLLLITPALTAGALGREKENDTLTALFTTELGDYEIVRGKVLGRFWQLMTFLLFCMPLPCIIAGFAHVDLMHVLVCYLHAFIITFAMTGICIFSAVITRRTRDAIMACYSIIIIITLISLTLLGDKPLPIWLNPVEMVVGLSSPPFTSVSLPNLLAHLFIFWFIGYFFVKLSCWTIRWACLRQLEDRSMRWRWGIRTGIGDDPIRWRERHILGIAPLPALRTIPNWLGMLACLAFSISLIGGIVNNMTHGRMLQSLLHGRWSEFIRLFQMLNMNSIGAEVTMMGIILIVMSGITILVRCAGSITEEKRMKTWEDLLMTATPIEKIASSKMNGILQASVLYIIAYAIPMFLFSLLGGATAILPAVITFAITWVVVFFAANIGIGISLNSEENFHRAKMINVEKRIAHQYTGVID